MEISKFIYLEGSQKKKRPNNIKQSGVLLCRVYCGCICLKAPSNALVFSFHGIHEPAENGEYFSKVRCLNPFGV